MIPDPETLAEVTVGHALDDRSFAIRLMEHLVVPTFVIDKNLRVLVWNKACERLTGVMAAEVVGTCDHWRAFYDEPRPCLADLLARGDYQSINTLYAHLNGYGMSDFGVSAEHWCVMPKVGRKRYLALDAGPIYDESGTLIAVVETVRDITAQREAQLNLETLASEDGLTGLPNRRSFDEALKSHIRKAAVDRQPLSLVMIDIDCFKAFNDGYGHQSGDECLRTVAQTIARALARTDDMAARYGGEEFAVILPRTDEPSGRRIAEDIRDAVEGLHIDHEHSIVGPVVTVSLGIATGSGTELVADHLIAAADKALYESKQGGRNRVSVAETEDALTLF